MENRIERITAMEGLLNEALSIIEKADISYEELLSIQPAVSELIRYYTGPQWREDFEADENGLLPETLKRGVLSEDGIYNLLLRNKKLIDEYNRGQK